MMMLEAGATVLADLGRFVEHAGNWEVGPPAPYFWLRFRCTLKPGRYHVVVRATDLAGNPQQKVARGVLHVVGSGAPAAQRPWWPSGLPGTYAPREGGLLARLTAQAAARPRGPLARALLLLRLK